MKLLNTTIGIVLIITTMLMIGCEATDHAALDKQDPLQRLLDGNARFVNGDLWHPHQTAARVKETASGQHPFAVVITCSDSRVSPEIMFDEGIGDLFTIRTAGNLLSDIELGSVEYAVEHLGAKLIAVVGHTECGAVKAFVEGGEAPGHIADLVEAIAQESEEQAVVKQVGKNLPACIAANVLHGVDQLRHDQPLLSEKITSGEVKLVPMLYDLSSGKVKVLNEQELRKEYHLR